MTADTTDDTFDISDLVHTQVSRAVETLAEPFSPHVVGPLRPLKQFNEPVYKQVHQEPIAAGETTENIADIPVEEEQAIVQEIPEVVGPLPPVEEFTAPVSTPARADFDEWIAIMTFEGELPAEPMLLRQHAQEASAERAARELLADEEPCHPEGKEGQSQKVSCGRCTSWHFEREFSFLATAEREFVRTATEIFCYVFYL